MRKALIHEKTFPMDLQSEKAQNGPGAGFESDSWHSSLDPKGDCCVLLCPATSPGCTPALGCKQTNPCT